MSTKDKVALLFTLPHVLGHTSDILEPDMREPLLLTALSTAQLLIITCSGTQLVSWTQFSTVVTSGFLVPFKHYTRPTTTNAWENTAVPLIEYLVHPMPERYEYLCTWDIFTVYLRYFYCVLAIFLLCTYDIFMCTCDISITLQKSLKPCYPYLVGSIDYCNVITLPHICIQASSRSCWGHRLGHHRRWGLRRTW